VGCISRCVLLYWWKSKCKVGNKVTRSYGKAHSDDKVRVRANLIRLTYLIIGAVFLV
jgi:hypothetical protein